MALGENLRRLRKEKGWTQHELAERAGIKLTHISTLEKVESDPQAFDNHQADWRS